MIWRFLLSLKCLAANSAATSAQSSIFGRPLTTFSYNGKKGKGKQNPSLGRYCFSGVRPALGVGEPHFLGVLFVSRIAIGDQYRSIWRTQP